MTADEIREDIELAVVELIKAKLADGTMTEMRSQQISQLVLDTLKPGMSLEELYKAILPLMTHVQNLLPLSFPMHRNMKKILRKSQRYSIKLHQSRKIRRRN